MVKQREYFLKKQKVKGFIWTDTKKGLVGPNFVNNNLSDKRRWRRRKKRKRRKEEEVDDDDDDDEEEEEKEEKALYIRLKY